MRNLLREYREYVLVILFLLALLSALVTLAFMARRSDPNPIRAPVSQTDGLHYQRLTVEGMPCLTVKSELSNHDVVTAITCDWSKASR